MSESPLQQAAVRSALNSAAAMLARRDHSCRELREKLRRRGFDGPVARAAVDECLRLGYIDEPGAARRFDESRARRGYGPRYTRRALQKHGYDAALIEEALAPYATEARQAADARRALEKKLRSGRPDRDPRRRKEKLYRFLCNRGFSPRVVRRLLLDGVTDPTADRDDTPLR